MGLSLPLSIALRSLVQRLFREYLASTLEPTPSLSFTVSYLIVSQFSLRRELSSARGFLYYHNRREHRCLSTAPAELMQTEHEAFAA